MNDDVPQLPFSAVVGQEEAKLSLILNAVDRRVGGVLLRGEKGSAKSTLARGLAALLPGHAPFVELPIGATEDRVIGTLDLAAALTGGGQRFAPGLLAAVDGGVLYVDEINLLPDHLVDVLLDVAASGMNRVERESISHTHPSRFLLVGSMNPEEGELRPQLLDRFGLAVEVRGATDPAQRAEAVRRRLAFDDDPDRVRSEVAAGEAALRQRLAAAVPASLPQNVVAAVAALCASVGAQGLRADLTICRAAAALAGWEGRTEVTQDEVRRVAPLALAHRARRNPLDPTGLDESRLAEALDEHFGACDLGASDPGESHPGDSSATGQPDGAGTNGPSMPSGPAVDALDALDATQAGDDIDPAPKAVYPGPVPVVTAPLPDSASRLHRSAPPAAGRRAPDAGRRGRLVGDRAPDGPVDAVAVGATVRRAAARRDAARVSETGSDHDGGPLVRAEDIRQAVRVQRTASLIVVAVDASGSMGGQQRMAAAKGAVLGLLTDAYQHRDLVGLVAFGGEEARVLLRPTSSVEVARARLEDLPTGGRTPLAAGIQTALELATAPGRAGTHRPVLVLITDGRATAGPPGADPLEAATSAADRVRRAGVVALVIDAEGVGAQPGAPRLGLARLLAGRLAGRHVELASLDGPSIEGIVRTRSQPA
jgi:magnesium chelatase subunit D